MTGKLAFSLSTRAGCVGILKEGYRYRGSRVIRADSFKSLKLKADAAVKSGGCRWVTMNGSHVLIRGSEIVGGAGGRLNGVASRRRRSGGKAHRGAGIPRAPIHRPHAHGGKEKSEAETLALLKDSKPLDVSRVQGLSGGGQAAPSINSLEEAGTALEKAGFRFSRDDAFKDIDARLALETLNQLLELEQKFGVAKSLPVTLNTARLPRGVDGETIRDWDGKNAVLRLDSGIRSSYAKYLSRLDRDIARKQAMPCDPSKRAVYTLTHEYAHLFQMRETLKEARKKNIGVDYGSRTIRGRTSALKNLGEKLSERWIRQVIRIARSSDPEFNIHRHLSTYGAFTKGNYEEAFAELFANSQCGAPNEAGRAMNIWLKEKGYVRV